MCASIKSHLDKVLILFSLSIFFGSLSQASEINLRDEIRESQASIAANASQILTEQGNILIDVQYRLSPLTISIYGDLPDDLDQFFLEEALKNFISSVPKAQKFAWPKFQISGYNVLVKSSSPFSVMDEAIPVKVDLLNRLLGDTYFVYTAFSPNCSHFRIKEIFSGFQEDDRIELESKIRDIIESKPGKSMVYYLNRISKIKRLSSGKYIRSLAGYKIFGSPKEFGTESKLKAQPIKIHQAIRNFFEHGTRDIKVSTWNFDDNTTEDKSVVRNFRTLATHILKLFLKDNHGTISTTPNHPFFVAGKGWIKAAKLKNGDVLVGKDSRIQVAGVRLEKLPKPMYLHNLEVEKYNNYFVVSAKTKKPMLVHNCNDEDYDDEEDIIAMKPHEWNNDNRDVGEIFHHICFTADTQIRVRRGAKSIKFVKVGDEVLSCNDKTNTCEYRKVEKKYRTFTNRLIHVKAEGMTHAIRSTPNHPYFVAELNDYVPAYKLKEGQHLVYQDPLTKENRLDVVESIEPERLSRKIPVYNFGVQKNENYYVAAANEFGDSILNKRFYLVHNCNEALSIAFDFTPILGGVKGAGEAYYGQDLMTQEDLAWWQRCLAAGAIVPGAGPALKRISKAAKLASKDEKVLKQFAKLEKDADKVIAAEAKVARDTPAGNGFRGPAAKNWNWEHILERHAPGGKTAIHRGKPEQIFNGMNDKQIQKHVQEAWKNRKNLGTQIDRYGVERIKYRGTNPSNGQVVEFRYNKTTKTVETAYPVD